MSKRTVQHMDPLPCLNCGADSESSATTRCRRCRELHDAIEALSTTVEPSRRTVFTDYAALAYGTKAEQRTADRAEHVTRNRR